MPDPDLYTTIPTDRVLITAKSFHILLAVLPVYSVGAVWLFVYLVGPTKPSGPHELGFVTPEPAPTLEPWQYTVSITSPTLSQSVLMDHRLCSTILIQVGTSQDDTLLRCPAQP